MARTVGSVISETRGHLNDTVAPFRYLDTDLYQYFGDAILLARLKRSDLFITFGLRASIPQYSPTTDLATPYPIDETYAPATALYVAGRAELRDDEFATDGRAAGLMNALVTALNTL